MIVLEIPVAVISGVNGVLTAFALFLKIFKNKNWQKPPVWLLLIFFLISLSIFLSPLKDWDARSIWFFHAKIFHFENLKITSTLEDPSVSFSHPHYPHFFPLMTAYVLSPWELWNAYVPKISLWLLLIPMGLGFVALTQGLQRRLQIYFGLALFGLPGALLWNGYMDGYLAGFFVLGTLALVQSFEDSSKAKAWLASFFYAICILLKQEGLALVALSCFAASFHYYKRQKISHLLLLVPIVFALLLHLWIKNKIHVTDYLLESASPQKYFLQRIFDISALGILGKYLMKSLLNVFIFSLILRYWFVGKKYSWNLFSTIAVMYTLLLCVIYLSSSFNLEWYLNTSAMRTLLVVQLLWVLSAVFYLRSEEFFSPK